MNNTLTDTKFNMLRPPKFKKEISPICVEIKNAVLDEKSVSTRMRKNRLDEARELDAIDKEYGEVA